MSATLRRFRNFSIALVAGGVLLAVSRLYELSLRSHSFLDGWVLAACVIALVLFNARKKIPVLPLVPVRVWTRIHIYLGWFSAAAFLVHTRMQFPNGAIETALWVMFIVVVASGVLGAYLSASIPARLTRHGEPIGLRRHGERVIFERIPAFRKRLIEDAEALAMRSIDETRSVIIAEFYAARIQPYLAGPRNMLLHLFESDRPRHTLREHSRSLQRYLDPRGRELLNELDEIVAVKENLDYHYALQGALKAWLFIHIPATYAMIVLAGVHVLMAYAYSAGTP